MRIKRFFIYLLLFPLICAHALSEPVTVCILDSGCSVSYAQGWNYVSDSDDLTDSIGHGTGVYSLLRANAPDVRIYMLKCFETDVSLGEESVVNALYAAVDQYGADIVNMSWTGAVESDALREAVQYAAKQGVILVASAGNLTLSMPYGAVVYPAAWEEVIGVAGVNVAEDGTPVSSLWYLSGEMVYVCANAEYEGERGSSYAAARVSALIASELEMVPELTREDISLRLRERAEDLGEPGYDTIYGWGYVACD